MTVTDDTVPDRFAIMDEATSALDLKLEVTARDGT